MFYSKRGINTCGVDIYFFDVCYERVTRSGCQFVFEGFNTGSRPLSQSFDATVIEVPYITNDLMPSRRTLGKKTKAHPLDFAADEESARNLNGH